MRTPKNKHEAVCLVIEDELPLLQNLPFLDRNLSFQDYETYRDILDPSTTGFDTIQAVEDGLIETTGEP